MMTEEMAQAAARWWRDKIDGGARHDNGDYSLASRMACMMADCLNEPTDADRLEIFERELTRMLMKEGEDRDDYSIYSDYGPSWHLNLAAHMAGISPMNFPYKTWMFLHVKDGEIIVRDGYGAPPRLIWKEQKAKEG